MSSNDNVKIIDATRKRSQKSSSSQSFKECEGTSCEKIGEIWNDRSDYDRDSRWTVRSGHGRPAWSRTGVVLQALDADPRGIQRGAGRFFVPRPLDSLHDVNEREEKLPISLSFSSSFPFASLCVQHAHVRLSIPPVPAGTQDYGDTFSCAMLRGNRPANTPCRRYDKDTRGQMGCTRKGQISTEQIPFYVMCFLEHFLCTKSTGQWQYTYSLRENRFKIHHVVNRFHLSNILFLHIFL